MSKRAKGGEVKIKVGDKLHSNYGDGPLVATVVVVSDEIVRLCRATGGKSPNATSEWTLPMLFFQGPNCGWKPKRKARP